MQFGVNGWVWTSPVNTQAFEELAPKVKKMGFDLFEFGIEGTSDLDYATRGAGRQGQRPGGQRLRGDGARSGSHPRGRRHPEQRDGLRRATASTRRRRSGATNVVGPLYSAVGRTWQQTADERQRDTDLLVDQLKTLSRTPGDSGVMLCVEPLNRFETSFLNLASAGDRGGRPRRQRRVRHPARHLPHEHRGEVGRRRDPRRRARG